MSWTAALPEWVGLEPERLCDEVEALIIEFHSKMKGKAPSVWEIRRFALFVQIETVRHYKPEALMNHSEESDGE